MEGAKRGHLPKVCGKNGRYTEFGVENKSEK